jgi:hypothetical protein
MKENFDTVLNVSERSHLVTQNKSKNNALTFNIKKKYFKQSITHVSACAKNLRKKRGQ